MTKRKPHQVQKLPPSATREAVQKLKSLQHNTHLNAEDLKHLGRLIDIRKSELDSFRWKVHSYSPIRDGVDFFHSYYGTAFEEIDLEIQTLDILYDKLCRVFEHSCQQNKEKS